MFDPGVFDRLVNDQRLAPYHGWHDDHHGATGDQYLPAVQQERAEFLELVRVIEKHELVGGKCLQLGLGLVGAAHLLFQKIFNEVLTIECDRGPIDALLSRFPGTSYIMHKNCHDLNAVGVAAQFGPFDFLFIDAGHLYADVVDDYTYYAPLVRKGGVIAFHDAMQRGEGVEVYLFLEDLEEKTNVHLIGSDIGTAWLVR
jgi:hypothetical protein